MGKAAAVTRPRKRYAIMKSALPSARARAGSVRSEKSVRESYRHPRIGDMTCLWIRSQWRLAVIAKRLDGTYQPGERAMIKVKR
jgi:hypothetical protein